MSVGGKPCLHGVRDRNLILDQQNAQRQPPMHDVGAVPQRREQPDECRKDAPEPRGVPSASSR
jgi:hypothetical protein